MLKSANLSRFFFYALVFLLPFQTRKVFFTENSFYFGYHAFYNTFFVYLTDLVFFGLILAWLWEIWNFSREKGEKPQLFRRILTRITQDRIYWFLATFWLILATSLIFSRENTLGFYGFVRITEYLLVFAYVRENWGFSRENDSHGRIRIAEAPKAEVRFSHAVFWLILATSWIQAGLGIWQYLRQKSLGLRILGEEFLRPGLPGIAEFETFGVAHRIFYQFFPYLSPISDAPTEIIRAYGTFPHPNVLAAFLFLALMVNLYLLYRLSFSREKTAAVVLSLSVLLITTGLVVSFSRLVWAVTFLAIVAWFGLIFWRLRRPQVWRLKTGRLEPEQARKYHPARLAVIAAALLLSLVFNWFMFGEQIKDRLGVAERRIAGYVRDESLANRNLLNQIALRMIKQNPVFGVGARNFVVAMDEYSEERLLPYLHQPVHNLYLLIVAEAGVLALFVFLVALYYIVRHAVKILPEPVLKYSLVLSFFGFLVLSFFDHYFWSIHQGSLMFWLVFGLVSAKHHE